MLIADARPLEIAIVNVLKRHVGRGCRDCDDCKDLRAALVRLEEIRDENLYTYRRLLMGTVRRNKEVGAVPPPPPPALYLVEERGEESEG